jgi:hypothetical protein
MKRFLVVLALSLSLPVVALATCTWTTDTGLTSGKVVCTSVAEAVIAGAAGTTVGWQANLCNKGMVFTACTDAGQAVTAAVTLSTFVYSPWAGLWGKLPDFNFTTETITAAQRCQTFAALQVVVPGGRIAVVPTAGTLDGGGLTIWWACN